MRTRSRNLNHRLTTAELCAAYPFMAGRSLGSRGVYVGDDLAGGGGFFYDPWQLYPDVITGPNMFVIGLIGARKSTLVKTYIWRQLVFGRQAWILDPKPEYEALCEAAGGMYITLRPGGSVRINPLDALMKDGDPDRVHQARIDLLDPLLQAATGRPLVPVEQSGIDEAMRAAALRANLEMREPTLRDVLGFMLEPTETMAGRLYMELDQLKNAIRDVGHGLRRLVDGDLRGMFDGPTSAGIDLDAPVVAFDLSRISNYVSLGVVMISIAAWLRRMLTEVDYDDAVAVGIRRLLVYDEAWKVMRVPGVARFMAEGWKLAGQWGVQNIALLHRFSDLAAAGGSDSEEIRLARGLLSDSQTRVIYQQPSNELPTLQELLQLTDTEMREVSRAVPGDALWKVGKGSFLVRHRLGAHERPLVDTDRRRVA